MNHSNNSNPILRQTSGLSSTNNNHNNNTPHPARQTKETQNSEIRSAFTLAANHVTQLFMAGISAQQKSYTLGKLEGLEEILNILSDEKKKNNMDNTLNQLEFLLHKKIEETLKELQECEEDHQLRCSRTGAPPKDTSGVRSGSTPSYSHVHDQGYNQNYNSTPQPAYSHVQPASSFNHSLHHPPFSNTTPVFNSSPSFSFVQPNDNAPSNSSNNNNNNHNQNNSNSNSSNSHHSGEHNSNAAVFDFFSKRSSSAMETEDFFSTTKKGKIEFD